MGERLRTGVPVAVLAVLGALLTGCTVEEPPAWSRPVAGGSEARVGDLAVRDAVLAYDGPIEGGTVYEPGQAATVRATVVNTGSVPDRLVGLRSPIAARGVVTGATEILPGQALAAGYTEPVASVVLPGTATVELTLEGLTTPVRAGVSYPVVLTFARAGEVRLPVRVANPDEPREGCALPPQGTAPELLTAPVGEAPVPPTPPPPDCSSLR